MNSILSAHSLSGQFAASSEKFNNKRSPKVTALALAAFAALDVAICFTLTCTVVPLIFLGKNHLQNTVGAIVTFIRSIFFLFGCASKPRFDAKKPYLTSHHPIQPMPITEAPPRLARSYPPANHIKPQVSNPSQNLAQFFEYARNYDIDGLKALLQSNRILNANQSENGETALICAIQSQIQPNKAEDTVRFLLSSRAFPLMGRAKLDNGKKVSSWLAAILNSPQKGEKVVQILFEDSAWSMNSDDCACIPTLPLAQKEHIFTLFVQYRKMDNLALSKIKQLCALPEDSYMRILSNFVIAVSEGRYIESPVIALPFTDVTYQPTQLPSNTDYAINQFARWGLTNVVVSLYMQKMFTEGIIPPIPKNGPEKLGLGLKEGVWDAFRQSLPCDILPAEIYELVLDYLLDPEGKKTKNLSKQLLDEDNFHASMRELSPEETDKFKFLLKPSKNTEKFHEKICDLLEANNFKIDEAEEYRISSIYGNKFDLATYIIEISYPYAADLATGEVIYHIIARLTLNEAQINNFLKDQ